MRLFPKDSCVEGGLKMAAFSRDDWNMRALVSSLGWPMGEFTDAELLEVCPVGGSGSLEGCLGRVYLVKGPFLRSVSAFRASPSEQFHNTMPSCHDGLKLQPPWVRIILYPLSYLSYSVIEMKDGHRHWYFSTYIDRWQRDQQSFGSVLF